MNRAGWPGVACPSLELAFQSLGHPMVWGLCAIPGAKFLVRPEEIGAFLACNGWAFILRAHEVHFSSFQNPSTFLLLSF